jgi:hypothetical protein
LKSLERDCPAARDFRAAAAAAAAPDDDVEEEEEEEEEADIVERMRVTEMRLSQISSPCASRFY